jgi:AraC-like DNA-binding protein
VRLLFFIRALSCSSRRLGAEGPDAADPSVRELVFVRSGRGRLAAESDAPGRPAPVKAGDLLFDPRGRLAADADSGPFELVQILFSETLFSPAVHTEKEALYVLGVVKLHTRQRKLISLSKGGAERLGLLTDNMLWEFRHRYRGYSWALRLKLIELLITVMRDKNFRIPVRGLKAPANSSIQDVILYLHTDYMNPIAVDDALKSCALGRSRFHELFKRETGQTFTAYLNGLRCDKAAELLANSDRTVLDVAAACGFANLSHFYHVFKRRRGVSPKAWRDGGRAEGGS